jgi:hypothetical protein
MRPLPAEFLRCHPSAPDAWCRNCKAWAGLPEQPPTTRATETTNSRSEACVYVPLSLQSKPKNKAPHEKTIPAAHCS